MINHEGPPPRFVLHVKTGKWHRQSQPPQRTVKTTGDFQCTLDYFLRKAMYGPLPRANTNRERSSPALRMREDSDAFEERVEKLRLRASSMRSGICEINPFVGLLGGVPLFDLYAALAQHKGTEWGEVLDKDANYYALVQLNFDELYEVCGRLVPIMVSREYIEHMFKALPEYNSETGSVTLVAFFAFMVKHTHHPRLDRNVSAIFKAFDPDDTGLISAATLTPAVFTAWAELGLFGKVRVAWERMGTVLESSGSVDLRVAGGRVLLTLEDACAVFCASRGLYMAMMSVDMEGSQLETCA